MKARSSEDPVAALGGVRDDVPRSGQGKVTLLVGALCVLLGLSVVIGWHTHNEALVQVRPQYTPMAYNTALCFVIGGAALLSLALGRRHVAGAGGAVVATMGALITIQYVSGLDFGIDRFLVEPYITVESQNPGRMAPNTAICFSLAGVALAVMGWARRQRWGPLAAGVLGAVVTAVGADGLSGYFTGIKTAYAWGPMVPMAVHSATGFIVLGTGIVARAWLEGTVPDQGFPRWLPILVGVSVATLTVGQWQAAIVQDQTRISALLAAEASQLQSEITAHIENRLQTLIRMAHRSAIRPDKSREEWEADATLHLKQVPGYQAIGWMEASTRLRWIVPLKGNEGAAGVLLALEEWQRIALERSRWERGPILTRPVRLSTNDRKGFIAFVPIFTEDGFLGWISGVFDAKALVDSLPGTVRRSAYAVSISDGNEAIYVQGGDPRVRESDWNVSIDIPLSGVTWRARIWPTPGLLDELQSILPSVVLSTGLLMALLIGVAVHLALQARVSETETRIINRALEREVHERRLTEEALRQSEERLARVVETIVDGVFIVDGDGQISFANATAEKLVGLSREVITQRRYNSPAWKVTTLDGKPFPETEFAVAQVMRTGEPVYGVEQVLDRPDGSRIVISVNAAPMRDATGAVTGVVASVSDVTRRKEVEQMKDTFVSTVSHELRTPLASLRGFAELMLQREFPVEKRREFLTIIHTESVRLGNLINDFLDIQRMESGRHAYDFRAVDLAPLFETTKALFGAGKHRLRLELPPDLPRVRADPDRIRQVLSNLVSNALKFSPEGSEVTLGARVGDGKVEAWVADQGLGISADALPKLFTKFFRADDKETRGIGGTGLGLALVKEIVEAHGGWVWVESKPGEGSTFSFSLPEVERTSVPIVAPNPLHAAPTEVILIEDDQAFARLLSERFAEEGLSVVVTSKGEQALEHLRRSPARLAILDIHLAGTLDGWDVLTALKGDPVLRSVPILVVSASEAINGRGLALAGADYIPKPVSCEWLLQAARDQLSSLSGKHVLVVDDDEAFCRQTRECLTADARVEVVTAVSGKEALERMAQRMPDLLLLDLLMPEIDGFEVLRRLRLDKRAVNLPVLIVTGKELSLENKAYIKRRMAALVRKQEASLDRIVDTVRQHLGAGSSKDLQVA